jgi:hypothetical protein
MWVTERFRTLSTALGLLHLLRNLDGFGTAKHGMHMVGDWRLRVQAFRMIPPSARLRPREFLNILFILL